MDKISRRGFFESALAAAAAALAADSAGATPSHDRRRERRVSANDKIHMAVIGVNGRGKDHVMGWLGHPEVELVAICDIDERVARGTIMLAGRGDRPKPTYYQDIRKLLEDPKLDAVSIATPNHWHSLAAIWAMQAGKDVYVEKPVCHNVTEGRRMVQVARKTNRICQAGTQIRSSAGPIAAMEYIHSGKLGKITLARGLCYKRRDSIGHRQDGVAPEGVDYDIWLGPAPVRPFNPNRFHYNWHWNWDYGNGDLGNQGIHQMDVCRWALNKSVHPQSVLGLGGRFGYEDDGQTPNTELTFYDYGDAHLIFEVRGLPTQPLKGATVGNIVYGTEGYVVFPGYNSAVAFDTKDNVVQKFEGGGDHYGNFLKAVRSRNVADLHADILEGYLSSALCHLGNISYRLGESQPFSAKTGAFGEDKEAYDTFGRFEQHLAEDGIQLQQTNYTLGPRLKFNSKAERFEHHAQANELLTRTYRAPFVVPVRA
jgi:predicted dehydrogenase